MIDKCFRKSLSSAFPLILVLVGVFGAAAQKRDVTVAADGSGDVKTISEALARVPENNPKRFVIYIKPGRYDEQVRVPANKPYVSFVGSDAKTTILSFNISNKQAGSTSAAYATYIGGHDFHAENVTFENSFGPPSEPGGQAVALLVEADRSVFRKCRFLGWQDTLYAKNGRQYYVDSYIEGSTDFIFGQAAAVFENSEIYSKTSSFITAPMRFAAAEPAGLVFIKSRLTAKDPKSQVYLGRPWRDYGRTVFVETEMGEHIRPEGWHNWQPEREKTAYLAEYKSTGPGAKPEARVKWSHQLTDAEAKTFAPEVFLKGKDGWNPKSAEDVWLQSNKPDYKLVTWSDVFRQAPLWYQTDEAARIADQLILYQKENGGWDKNVDMTLMLTQKERAELAAKRGDISETTIDNRTTYTQLAYLAKVITACLLKPTPPNNFPKYKDAFFKGVDYLLSSQYENGGFPQFFPLKKGYYTHITYNDDAMIGVLKFLRQVAKKDEDFKFVDEERRLKAEKAVEKGKALTLRLQVEIGGKKTVWAAQYDEFTLKPADARKFEPISLTAGESVGIVRFLMLDAKPSKEIVDAIESAVDWYRKNQINGIRWERHDGNNVVVKDKAAPPIWARFYQMDTMKPIFIGRDAIIKYDVSEIEAERRNGYAWYISEPGILLGKDYPRWKQKIATGADLNSK